MCVCSKVSSKYYTGNAEGGYGIGLVGVYSPPDVFKLVFIDIATASFLIGTDGPMNCNALKVLSSLPPNYLT